MRERRPVVIVLHQSHSNPGHVGQWLRMRGHALDVRRPRYGDPLPQSLEHHAGAIIFGGPMSANDPDEFIRTETEWIEVALRERKPFLGICLGAQMLARHLGARVFGHPDSHVEIGYHPICPTPHASRFGRWPERVYQWHREGFDRPHGAVALATANGTFETQAVVYGETAFAVQFHPEITYAMVNRWSGSHPQRLTLPGAQDRPSQLSDHLSQGPAVRRWLDAFMPRWLASDVQRAL
ncbi:MAG: gamma-glutamyl-gamma-aminobutyrate hydrolase family protein [Hyphomicrobiaceae bacterium]|nr:gamma-glutamyl-gamma-aminobutyrate hydrolase family protein [Hyphomicrobiaceae bacterium]